MSQAKYAEELTSAYLGLRQRKDALNAKLKEDLKPINEAMAEIEEGLLLLMNSLGASSLKTTVGTPYTKQVTSLKIEDWEQTLDFIRESGNWHLLTKSLTKTDVLEMMEAGTPVPGVTVNSFDKLFVRTN